MKTTNQTVTFEQYLTYNDSNDTRYEIERGELIPKAVDKRVTVLNLVEGFDDEAVFRAEQALEIPNQI